MKEVPLIYWIPKNQRYTQKQYEVNRQPVQGFVQTSIKPLSKHFSKALKLILNQMKVYSDKVFERSNLHYYWILDNSLQFMEKLKDSNIQHMQTRAAESENFRPTPTPDSGVEI